MIAALHIKCDWCEAEKSYYDEDPEIEAHEDGWLFLRYLFTGEDGEDDQEKQFCSDDCLKSSIA